MEPIHTDSSDYRAVVEKRFDNQTCLRELWRAYKYANRMRVDRWQFAVSLDHIMHLGAQISDIRYMVAADLLEHRSETTSTKKNIRTFREASNLDLNDSSAFVLTDRGIRITEVYLPEYEEGLSFCQTQSPMWDHRNRELRHGRQLVKKFARPALNQEAVLAAFEEEAWPIEGIFDPLFPIENICPKERLRDTVKSLNRNQKHGCRIHFTTDGDGELIYWRAIA